MSAESNKTYDIGYKKPPKATRFQKGKSGNPSGRPKEIAPELDPGKILQSIDNEEIVVMVDGKRKRMRKAEIDFQQSFAKATKGDLTTATLIAKMAAKYFGPEAEGPSELRLIVVPDRTSDPNQAMSSGYPKNARFKKGRSDNPNGRPRENQRQVSVGSLFRKVAREQVRIEVEGNRITMSRWEVYVHQIYTMALNKNNRAARLLDQLRRQFPGDIPPGDPVVLLITEDDARL